MGDDQISSDFYYNMKGERVFLERDPTAFAVRFNPGKRSDDPSLPLETQRFLREESENIDFIAQYNLQVYRTRLRDPAKNKFEISALNASEAVDFATPVFRRSEHYMDRVFLTNRFLVEFKPDVTEQEATQYIQTLKTSHGVSVVERLDYVRPNIGYLLMAPSGFGDNGPIALAQRCYETGLMRHAMPDIVQRRALRGTCPRVLRAGRDESNTDTSHNLDSDWTYKNQQWHLDKAKVPEAWKHYTRGDPSIEIAVSDDGIDVHHPEFEGKVKPNKQYDFALDVADGTPKSVINKHGTACAGVAVARGIHAYGAAPDCNLMAVRFPDYMGVADEARMFQWMADNGADIISCSWGPPDGTGAHYPIPDNVASAIHYCVTKGRNGKGIPIFWAAGNGNELVSKDGYAANPEVIAIAAITERDIRAHYSDFGPEICISAPSSGSQSAGDRRIFTTDRQGPEGYNPGGSHEWGDEEGNYTNDFGGTSSAAPLVAGIAGLMLSANPDLYWHQIKNILMQTADKVGDGYDENGHSDNFGHGRVNALEAVRAALAAGSVEARIEGPETITRTAGPPQFLIQLPASRFYAIEVATESRLFNSNQFAADRTATNFYASWADSGFFSSPLYQLPVEVWDRLKVAARLYYRMWINASATQWTSYCAYATTPSNQADAAPYINITGDGQSLSILGPTSHVRWQGPPRFRISFAMNHYYAVEVATMARLFNDAQHGAERNTTNFYASWQNSNLLSEDPYELPSEVWDSLNHADRLYYRMWTSSSASDWVDTSGTTPDGQYEEALFIRLLDG